MNFSVEQPPEITGDVEKDIEALREYIAELIDELEYRLRGVKSDNE